MPPSQPAPERSTGDSSDAGAGAASSEADIPVRLPRAMRSVTVNGGPFRERNSERSTDAVDKDSAAPPPRSPVRRNRAAEEKENFGH